MGLRQKLQVLCEGTGVLCSFPAAFWNRSPKRRKAVYIPSSTLPQALRQAARAGWRRAHGPTAHRRRRPGPAHRQIQGGQHRYAQRIHRAALGGDGAHLGVTRAASWRNVRRVLAGR